MIWTIIGFIVSTVIIICICCDEYMEFGVKFLLSFLTILMSTLLTLLVTLCASGLISCDEPNYNMVSDTKIVALKDNQNIGGNFYIFGGYVNEDLYYYYATETEFGYKTEKVSAANAYIKYTDGETHIERYEGEFASKKAYVWGFPMYEDKYIIYCPDGTVTNEFNVDLE